ncbi:hypothetical protein BDY24DRAFT_396713 [Mrakia frigida]|uniref:SDR family NAD(P)-dependent oxidoreductase n=1 Tax=Mrakia frigida TaxID=29902 RepID=UPI003FCC2416
MSLSQFSAASLFDVSGKVVLVTGGGSGLGRAIASAFVANGAKVFITGRRLDSLLETKRLIESDLSSVSNAGSIEVLQGSVSSKEDILKIKEAYVKAGGERLDVLVNCAGVMKTIPVKYDVDDVEKLEDALWSPEWSDFDVSFATNITAMYFVSVAFLPFLRLSDSPSITNICSIAAYSLSRKAGTPSYGPSKAGAVQLTQQLAARFMPFKIRVNALCPGLMPSEMTAKTAAEMEAGPLGPTIATIPLKRVGHETEIAGPVLFLSSKAGGYVDGSVLVVDGGRLMTITATN